MPHNRTTWTCAYQRRKRTNEEEKGQSGKTEETNKNGKTEENDQDGKTAKGTNNADQHNAKTHNATGANCADTGAQNATSSTESIGAYTA